MCSGWPHEGEELPSALAHAQALACDASDLETDLAQSDDHHADLSRHSTLLRYTQRRTS